MKNPGLPWTVVQDVPQPKVFGIEASEAEIQLDFSFRAYASTWENGHFSKFHKDCETVDKR